MSPEEILTWVDGQIWSKRQWLETHKRNWPAHDVEAKEYDLSILAALKRHMERQIEHKKGRAA